jgi:hypothetical protein
VIYGGGVLPALTNFHPKRAHQEQTPTPHVGANLGCGFCGCSCRRRFIYFRCVFLIHALARNAHRGASVQRPQSWVNTAEKMPTGCRAPRPLVTRSPVYFINAYILAPTHTHMRLAQPSTVRGADAYYSHRRGRQHLARE